VAALFSLTLFLSAMLLFVVQPMIGKMLLPPLGGAPSVWNTCLVFFQAVLLLGYLYAHLATRWLGNRRHALAHIGLMLLPFALLPVRLSNSIIATVPHDGSPLPWLLGFLTRTAAVPLLIVSATSPLLQKWFADTRDKHARDPYFLYAASNAGSMLGLFIYPILAEPLLAVRKQTWLWTAGYGVLVLLVAACAFAMMRSSPSNAPALSPVENTAGKVTLRRRLRWMLLAFVPSSLMLGVTTYLTTDVAPLPLFWVVPLALYLLTFILVFARRPLLPPRWLRRALCLPALVLIVAFVVGATEPAWLMIPLHLLVFFLAAWICHGELAKDRPDPRHLTDFYLCLSGGGVLGGMFNALLAPLIFRTVLEYPLVMALACSIRFRETKTEATPLVSWADAGWALGIGGLTTALILIVQGSHLPLARLGQVLIFGAPAMLVYRFVKRPVRFGLGLVAILVAGHFYTSVLGRSLLVDRNFFGVLRVTVDDNGQYRQLVHGHTLHGRQSLRPLQSAEPLAYYYRTGPIGQVFDSFNSAVTNSTVAIVGLGAGSLASYGRTGQDWTFYEINPAVERIARDPRYFTLLSQSAASKLSVVLGDARLRLAEAPDGHYRLIVLDAFSSDAIPIHLVTREALALYLSKLADGGILAFHISNRRLDLRPVLAKLARDARLTCLVRDDSSVSAAEQAIGKTASRWAIMARQRDNLGALTADPRWTSAETDPRVGLWTDDFSNILSVLQWR
jgi:hypothetical protein